MSINREDFPAPRSGILVTNVLTARDVAEARRFYADVLGGSILLEQDPCIIKLANTWITIVSAGGPTEDKPDVSMKPPGDSNQISAFMNLRVADIAAKYAEWRSKGAHFLTPPIDRGGEIRCYMRDPDGYLLEVGEATGILEMLT